MKELTFILLYVTLGFSSMGLGMLYLYLIRKGQSLDFMQKLLKLLDDHRNPLSLFLYKSIGGCEVCTIQRFTDLSFVVLMILTPLKLHFTLWFIVYCLYGGFVFFISNTMVTKTQPKITSEKIDL